MPTVPISVVIPAFNAEKYIRQAIKSVRNQTVQVAEIIVVDNYCSDKTAEIAKSMGAIVLEKPDRNQGISAARNRGIRASKFEWIALLDADDFWEKRKIEYQWEAITRFQGAGLVSCGSRIFQTGTPINPEKWKNWLVPIRFIPNEKSIKINRYTRCFLEADWAIFSLAQLHTSSVILKKDVFTSIGMFDESLPVHEDNDLFLRILAKYPLLVVNRRLSSYRRHQENVSDMPNILEENLNLWLKKILQKPANYPSGTKEGILNNAKINFIEQGRNIGKIANL